MGIDINRRTFSAEDYQLFDGRLEQQLGQLGALLADPSFGVGPSSIGCEPELYIVDGHGRPALLNELLLAQANDPQLTLELDRYNLEFNLSPGNLADGILQATEAEILNKVSGLNAIAARFDARVVPIGILPTLTPDDFGLHSLTDRERYHALLAQLVKHRGAAFPIRIDGEPPLDISMSDITLEGANTSFQMHWRVNPDEYVDTFNAVQLVTPLVLAVAANSPGIFGHQLWDETRIPLFKQSIDTRQTDRYEWRQPARVSFGQGWVRRSAEELFVEAVRLFPPLLPVVDTAPEQTLGAPSLAELRLHQGTVWLWNRPVYDPVGDGHLRIELRSLPAGPSAVDMVANAALHLGLAVSVRADIDARLPALPFALAERNFYRAAQRGLDAELLWPELGQHGLKAVTARDLLMSLLPCADEGLASLGVSANERDRYLGVIERRLLTGYNPAGWQRAQVARHCAEGETRDEALKAMLEDYIHHAQTNAPLAEWPL